jgi:hypothetical protein
MLDPYYLLFYFLNLLSGNPQLEQRFFLTWKELLPHLLHLT